MRHIVAMLILSTSLIAQTHFTDLSDLSTGCYDLTACIPCIADTAKYVKMKKNLVLSGGVVAEFTSGKYHWRYMSGSSFTYVQSEVFNRTDAEALEEYNKVKAMLDTTWSFIGDGRYVPASKQYISVNCTHTVTITLYYPEKKRCLVHIDAK